MISERPHRCDWKVTGQIPVPDVQAPHGRAGLAEGRPQPARFGSTQSGRGKWQVYPFG